MRSKDLIGTGEFEQRSVSTSSGEHGRRSQTEGDTYHELAPAHVVRETKEASAVMVYGSLPPTTVQTAALVPKRDASRASGRCGHVDT